MILGQRHDEAKQKENHHLMRSMLSVSILSPRLHRWGEVNEGPQVIQREVTEPEEAVLPSGGSLQVVGVHLLLSFMAVGEAQTVILY